MRIIQHVRPAISFRLPDELAAEWQQAKRIMIIHGQDHPGSSVSDLLRSLSGDRRIIIMAENISHVTGAGVISSSNIVLSNSRNSSPALPDLIIHSGGQVVSKALTGYLRRADHIACWRLGCESNLIDTFRLVTRQIPLEAEVVYRAITGQPVPLPALSYQDEWIETARNVHAIAEGRIRHMPFSDVRVFSYILQRIPPETFLVLGNSSVIRYSQLFPADERLKYYANRGVSGIDGSLSTAAGLAFAAQKPTVILTGDMGFLYDSNALWNRELPANLRIVVINNGGGGIFHILKGPTEFPGFRPYIEAHHPVNMDNLAGAYGLDYYFAEDGLTLGKQWESFLNGRGRASIFEVKTDASISATTFRQLMVPD
jgi:2-succinyl-5-enolpyruvyl-6-hydroxy-3-cyclohexene-1-carboxylate synthase